MAVFDIGTLLLGGEGTIGKAGDLGKVGKAGDAALGFMRLVAGAAGRRVRGGSEVQSATRQRGRCGSGW